MVSPLHAPATETNTSGDVTHEEDDRQVVETARDSALHVQQPRAECCGASTVANIVCKRPQQWSLSRRHLTLRSIVPFFSAHATVGKFAASRRAVKMESAVGVGGPISPVTRLRRVSRSLACAEQQLRGLHRAQSGKGPQCVRARASEGCRLSVGQEWYSVEHGRHNTQRSSLSSLVGGEWQPAKELRHFCAQPSATALVRGGARRAWGHLHTGSASVRV